MDVKRICSSYVCNFRAKKTTTKVLNAGEASTIMSIPIGTRITGLLQLEPAKVE